WEIFVETDGMYDISLRRWPREFNFPITSQPQVPVDLKDFFYFSSSSSYASTNDKSKKISATQAQLNIAGQHLVKHIPDNILGNAGINYDITENGEITAVNFRLRLMKGSTKLSAWFVNGRDDGDIAGAYYVYITKL
ncbi:MAG: hypothetical protein CMG75_06395, partial [Candidatus Marinimicrobia bacterium]|nr:hypothetical protein [Candidatus Neomarinimicrobiota bacterium]